MNSCAFDATLRPIREVSHKERPQKYYYDADHAPIWLASVLSIMGRHIPLFDGYAGTDTQ